MRYTRRLFTVRSRKRELGTFTSSSDDSFTFTRERRRRCSAKLSKRGLTNDLTGTKRRNMGDNHETSSSYEQDCIYESNSFAILALLFLARGPPHVRASEVQIQGAAFDISIPRLTRRIRLKCRLCAPVSGVAARINDCNRSLSCAS